MTIHLMTIHFAGHVVGEFFCNVVLADRNHFTTQFRQFFREYAVSATQIEDPFAGLWGEQIHDGRS